MFGRKPAPDKKEQKTPPAASEPQPGMDGFITLYDEYGREMQIERSEWVSKVLPDALQKNWKDADALASTIIMSLDDGFAPALLEASAQLVKIDEIKERSHVLRGIVLMKTGALKDAEKILNTGMKICGRTGYLLTNLAKVYFEQDRKKEALETLWQSMKADPNQDNGLLWWAALHNDEGGEGEYLNALRRVSMVEGSWRPQLFLARHALENGDIAKAEELYVYILQQHDLPPDAFHMMSGDLGHNGHLEAIIDLLEPVYDPEYHGVATGINLLHAYSDLDRRREGKALLERLYALERHDIRSILDDFSRNFDTRNHAPRPIPARQQENIAAQITPHIVDKPIWYYGLADPAWLFPPRKEKSETISFFVLGTPFNEDKRGQTEKTDREGRLSRGLPLYFAESLMMNGGHKAQAIIPVMPGSGPVVSGGPWPADYVFRYAKGSDIIVTGMMKPAGDGFDITLDILDGHSKAVLHSLKAHETANQEGREVERLERELLSYFEANGRGAGEPYARPGTDAMGRYINALEQSLALSFAVNNVYTPESLYGERSMLDWFLNMALKFPQMPQNALMFFSGLTKNRQYGSTIYKEYETKAFKLVKDSTPLSPAHLMLPVLHRLYDQDSEAEKAIAELKSADIPENRKIWLDTL